MMPCEKNIPEHRIRCFLKRFSYVLVRFLFRLQYVGLEHIPERGPLILIANHTSIMDMFAIHAKVRPWIHWVAKKELFSKPFLARLLITLGCIPVSRDKADLSAARGIMGVLKRDEIVGLFPQGTRVAPDRIALVLPRNGAVHFALKTHVPLLPVAIEGRFRLFSKIRIVFGEPFRIPDHQRSSSDPESLQQTSLWAMQRVYDLIGKRNVYRTDRKPQEETVS